MWKSSQLAVQVTDAGIRGNILFSVFFNVSLNIVAPNVVALRIVALNVCTRQETRPLGNLDTIRCPGGNTWHAVGRFRRRLSSICHLSRTRWAFRKGARETGDRATGASVRHQPAARHSIPRGCAAGWQDDVAVLGPSVLVACGTA